VNEKKKATDQEGLKVPVDCCRQGSLSLKKIASARRGKGIQSIEVDLNRLKKTRGDPGPEFVRGKRGIWGG